eukprot:TRINITY_DN9157_c0_g1_i1.p1 TRINITY_DN9157_c0_g1~~TRINITY_DN9157_c0_g1_i1.p1  ORF type:complete len:260 (+),score=21.82 TRINITY_DN9157_c0_g1_i1:98-781(+)
MGSKTSSNESGSTHIVLVGDSIFDNAVYVRGGRSVIDHLSLKTQSHSPEWKATLIAIDGDVVKGIVKRQINDIPKDATHIFVSIGGNDALHAQGITSSSVNTAGEALLLLAQVRANFQKQYTEMIEAVLKLKLPTTICTIYNPNFGEGPEQTVASLGLCAFNDVIIQTAIRYGLPLIDLKSMFNDKKDYANPIEPSEQGGNKLTDAIMNVMKNHDFQSKRTTFYQYQ